MVEVLSREEIQALEDAADNERDALVIRLLADTGIRNGELVKLRVADLVERDRRQYIRVRGKGNRERLVPVPRLYRRLQRFARGRPVDATSDRLFLARKRRAGADEVEPITESGIQQMLRNAARKAGIQRRVYPHLLRHSFATYQLTRGMNPIQLADILGHASLVMLHRTYSHLAPSDAYEAMVTTLDDV
jgi:integrase/recombinase XerD